MERCRECLERMCRAFQKQTSRRTGNKLIVSDNIPPGGWIAAGGQTAGMRYDYLRCALRYPAVMTAVFPASASTSASFPTVRPRGARLTTVVDRLSSLASSTLTDDVDPDVDLSTPASSERALPSVPPSHGTLQNLTQSLLANYTRPDYGAADVSNGSSTIAYARNSASSGLAGLSLPDLLEEDELMALWNCTNCFLLNYGTSGANGTVRYYGNGTADPRDVLVLPADGDETFASEATIYLIRVIATAIVLGIVILATVIVASNGRLESEYKFPGDTMGSGSKFRPGYGVEPHRSGRVGKTRFLLYDILPGQSTDRAVVVTAVLTQN
uniref:Uncharacterized protein n=1 Tax=Anopheles farauti TaxID=69004 RepID=A0A182QXU9_9DIPT